MDNKLILEKRDVETRLKKLFCNYTKIEFYSKFLDEYSECFKKEESIKALNKIREYILNLDKEYKDLEKRKDEINNEIISKCSHDIVSLNKYCNKDKYYCCMCGNDIDKLHINSFVIDVDDGLNYDVLYDLIYDIAKNNEDINDVFEYYVQQYRLNNKFNIKVLRRKK